MDLTGIIKRSMDDIVFEGRNKAYGAFKLRRLYDENMSKGMIISFLLFLLLISMPQIIRSINGMIGIPNEEPLNREHTFSAPPSIDIPKPPPPAPKAVQPTPKQQFQFITPTVIRDDEVFEDTPPPPTLDVPIGSGKSTEFSSGDLTGPFDAPPDLPSGNGSVIMEDIKEDSIFTFVEQMPSFPDGMAALYDYLGDNIKYPRIAAENRISGQVTIQFVVTKEGDIEKVKVIKAPGGGIGEEAFRVISEMPKWKPGKHNGKPVSVTFTMPINFVLKN